MYLKKNNKAINQEIVRKLLIFWVTEKQKTTTKKMFALWSITLEQG